MSSIKNIYLHIGAHKTGTTSIQQSLFTLEQQNILAQHNFGFSWVNAAGTKEELADDISRILKKPQNNIIISQEQLSNLMAPLRVNAMPFPLIVQTLAMALAGHNVVILIYLRRQDKFLESMWAQAVKQGTSSENFNTYKENYVDIYWKIVLDHYAQAFGKQNIRVRVYEFEKLYKNDVVSDFFEWINLDLPRPTLNSIESNLSLNDTALRIQLAYSQKTKLSTNEKENILIKLKNDYNEGKISKSVYDDRVCYTNYGLTYQHRESIRKILQGNYTIPPNSKVSYMSFEERKKFLEKFDEDNSNIAREYLNIKDGKLFSAPTKDDNELLITEEVSASDIVSVLLPALAQLLERIEELERNVVKLK